MHPNKNYTGPILLLLPTPCAPNTYSAYPCIACSYSHEHIHAHRTVHTLHICTRTRACTHSRKHTARTHARMCTHVHVTTCAQAHKQTYTHTYVTHTRINVHHARMHARKERARNAHVCILLICERVLSKFWEHTHHKWQGLCTCYVHAPRASARVVKLSLILHITGYH
jgi:hypothetical protein